MIFRMQTKNLSKRARLTVTSGLVALAGTTLSAGVRAQAAPAAALPPQPHSERGARPSSVATSVAAQGWVALRASTGTSLRNHHSMDLYTTDNTLRARGAGVGVDVWRPKARLALAVEGDWVYEKASSARVLGGSFNSWYTQHQVNLGVSIRYDLGGLHPVLALVSPHFRLFGGIAATKQRLSDRDLGTTYGAQYQANGGAGFALGFSVRSPSVLPIRNSSLLATSVGLRIEAGYGLMGDPELRLQPVQKAQHPIEEHAASLGALELDAAFLRVALELRI
jgi:hypothetical protein